MYALQQAGSQGHCYLPEDELIDTASGILMLDKDIVSKEIDLMSMNKEIIIQETGDERRLYTSRLYYMELNCARMLLDLDITFPVNEGSIEKKISQIGRQQDIILDTLQEQAALQAAMNGVLVITGGPGTGKTTTINTIISLLEEEGLEILLAAPTGRAAKRMSETSGREAQTIHRLLEINGGMGEDNGNIDFKINESQPLEADAVIVDEFSMVDIYLLHALLKALCTRYTPYNGR